MVLTVTIPNPVLDWSNASITSNLGVENRSRDIQLAAQIRF